jgi:hypothetical protein
MTNTPDLTPEAVERLAQDMQQHMPFGRGSATLRALSAALEAERASHTATLKDAQDECARAEAAEAERDTLKSENARLRELIGILVDPECGEIDRRLALKDARAALQEKEKALKPAPYTRTYEDGLEDAAKVAEHAHLKRVEGTVGGVIVQTRVYIAAAIRAMKGQTND